MCGAPHSGFHVRGLQIRKRDPHETMLDRRRCSGERCYSAAVRFSRAAQPRLEVLLPASRHLLSCCDFREH